MEGTNEDVESKQEGDKIEMDNWSECESSENFTSMERQNLQMPASDVLNIGQNRKFENVLLVQQEKPRISESDSIIRTALNSKIFSENSREVFNFSGGCDIKNMNIVTDERRVSDKFENKNMVAIGETKTFNVTDSKVISDLSDETLLSKGNQNILYPVTKKITNLPDGYTDSSHSSSSDLQMTVAPLVSSDKPHEKNDTSLCKNFEDAISGSQERRECDTLKFAVGNNESESTPIELHFTPKAREPISRTADLNTDIHNTVQSQNANDPHIHLATTKTYTDVPGETNFNKIEQNDVQHVDDHSVIEIHAHQQNNKPIVPEIVSEPTGEALAEIGHELDEPSSVSEKKQEIVQNSISLSITLPPNETLQEPVTGEAEGLPQQSIQEHTSELVLQTVPEPLPVVTPTPRKRGRPRKQVLPAPSPAVDASGNIIPGATPESVKAESKRSTRSERRQTKRKKLDEEVKKQPKENETPKRTKQSLKTPVQKKKPKKPVFVLKKRGPNQKKKHAEMENIQNFEEETRMSASEGLGGFSTKSGVSRDESQSSFLTEGHTKGHGNKKGRMEVMTDGCKPVTVQQLVEYHWPPPSSHGEKSEGLMIQEQITEYLGVKSFKRKYPTIKRRPVDMEERNYLQENGFVSENMCDMGLTAVFSADIMEIMYNDFPQKFEEYRKYAREKKAKEQRALRERQAAERADMDPLKEAVESAQNWNTEFNRTRRFKVLHARPDLRQLTDGSPCPPFEKVVIAHAPNNAPLCVEANIWTLSFFSFECEISAQKKITPGKKVDPNTMWTFVVGSV